MTTSKNIALLIDADNASPSGLDPALTVLAELGSVNIKRAYGNWSKAGLKSWAALTQRYAIEPQQQFDITKGKNATEMTIAIDVMDLLYSGQVDGSGIMSSDGDFMSVAMRLRQSVCRFMALALSVPLKDSVKPAPASSISVSAKPAAGKNAGSAPARWSWIGAQLKTLERCLLGGSEKECRST